MALAGRASALQAEGRRFDGYSPHHLFVGLEDFTQEKS